MSYWFAFCGMLRIKFTIMNLPIGLLSMKLEVTVTTKNSLLSEACVVNKCADCMASVWLASQSTDFHHGLPGSLHLARSLAETWLTIVQFFFNSNHMLLFDHLFFLMSPSALLTCDPGFSSLASGNDWVYFFLLSGTEMSMRGGWRWFWALLSAHWCETVATMLLFVNQRCLWNGKHLTGLSFNLYKLHIIGFWKSMQLITGQDFRGLSLEEKD